MSETTRDRARSTDRSRHVPDAHERAHRPTEMAPVATSVLRPAAAGTPGSGHRVLLVGLDAADAGILMAGVESGTLPRLRALRDEGAWGLVSSPRGFGSGAVWPSFATGVSPAKHGRYFYRQIAPGSYAAEKFRVEQFAAEPIWDHISRAGRSIAVFDVPKVGVSQDVNGVVAVDWISHGPVYDEMRTWPESFGSELTERFGSNPLWKCDLPGGRDADAMESFVRQMSDRIAQRVAATKHYWDQGFDLLVTVFAEPHCAGHQGWHVRDIDHPMHDPDVRDRVGDPVQSVYEQIDAAIGEIIDHVDDDTTVIVFSGTGMGPNYTGNHLLEQVLRAIDHDSATMAAKVMNGTKALLKRVMPPEVRRRGQRLKNRVEEQAYSGDRAKRRSFSVPHNDIAGAVRLNIVGREASGTIERHEVDDYVDHLRTELLALRNAETGEPVVTDVVRLTDEHDGDWIDHMPDLFVLWNRNHPIDRVTSDTIGEVEHPNRGNRTGDHNPENIFYGIGPGVRPGHVSDAGLYDFAPTLCALLDVDLPATDGTPIDAVFMARAGSAEAGS